LFSYDNHLSYEEIESIGKNPFLPTKPPEKEPKDLDNVVKLVKNFLNEVVDLKKNVGEGPSKPIPFRPFFRRNENLPKSQEIQKLILNMDNLGMDKYFSYHQQNRSEKTCP
jgi:hypothetical protein